ncbi:prepilin peptidase [Candidatus Saccharibacteria bacterium]|nr:prepilin peptidase [Candidatus Saccharibacteria bacterium]
MQDFFIYHSVFLIFMFILGSAFGSFLCCQARRLRLKQKGTKPKKNLGQRSVCLNCGYQLEWYDNLPIISWLFLKGRCKKCQKKIGLAEFLSELGLGIAFVLIANNYNLVNLTTFSAWAEFIFALLLTITLGFLAIYDGLYGELPSSCLTLSLICAIILATLRQWVNFSVAGFSFEELLPLIFSVLVLAGTYLILYLVSKGKWVGDGDWLLALTLALVLGHPWLALLTLFLANFLACLVMLPAMKLNKKSRKTAKIYLGPFLVSAFIIVLSFSNFFLSML